MIQASHPSPAVPPPDPATNAPRRNFLVEAAAFVIGGIVSLVPLVAGVLFFLDPLKKRRRSAGGPNLNGFVRVAALEAVPADGQPVKFAVEMDRTDAWNYFPKDPVGAVYIRRTENGKVVAFNVICPHLGCAVDYLPMGGHFHCPCHKSSFTVDGAPQNTTPPRGMDTLEVHPQKLQAGEVWVKFQNFRTGAHEKIAEA